MPATLILIAFVLLFPYSLSSGRSTVPFSSMGVSYSFGVNYEQLYLPTQPLSFALTTGNIVNFSYIEVTESVGASESIKFYVNLFNRSILISNEFLPEVPPHGEYYDLWIGEGHRAGEVVKVLNQTVTLSGSGLKFHGWLFFNTLTTGLIPFNFSREIDYQGSHIPVDYIGEISITYDEQTGLMVEDQQSWSANLTYPGLPPTIYYSIVLTYENSNVRFAYATYLLATGIYTALAIIIASLVFLGINMLRKRRPEEEPPTVTLETPQTPETPPEPSSENPAEPATPTNPETPKDIGSERNQEPTP